MNFEKLYIGSDAAYGVRIAEHGHGTFYQLVDYLLNGPEIFTAGEPVRRDPGPKLWYMTQCQCFIFNWVDELRDYQERQVFTKYLPRALNPSPGSNSEQVRLVQQCAEGLMSYAGAAAPGWYDTAWRHLKNARKEREVQPILSSLRLFMRALLYSRVGEEVQKAVDPFLRSEIEPYLDLIMPPAPAEFSQRSQGYMAELLELQSKRPTH